MAGTTSKPDHKTPPEWRTYLETVHQPYEPSAPPPTVLKAGCSQKISGGLWVSAWVSLADSLEARR